MKTAETSTRATSDGPPGYSHVYFVGAGPGDPELLTVRAVRLLALAEVVLVDDLAGEAVLALAPTARIIRVGKRGGCASTPQSFIERLMVREALAGRRVVRLKGGDCGVFGRLAEEIAALDAARVAWTVVPGITAGIAAAATLGVPLTDRERAHGVAFITGHGAEGADVDWSAFAHSRLTLVAYMAVARVGMLASNLLQAGMPIDTPVIAVERVGSMSKRNLASRLIDMEASFKASGLASPAVLLIGEAMRERALALMVGDAVRLPAQVG